MRCGFEHCDAHCHRVVHSEPQLKARELAALSSQPKQGDALTHELTAHGYPLTSLELGLAVNAAMLAPSHTRENAFSGLHSPRQPSHQLIEKL